MAGPARRPRREAQITRLLLVAPWIALLGACASVGDPPGGPPDTAPPRIISIQPESGSVVANFKDDIVIQFDETVEEQSGGGRGSGEAPAGLAQQVLLSPVAGALNVSWHRTRVTIKPKEGWKRRVYRLEVLPGFSDLRRNRFDSTATVLFSTGPEIGHARIGGIALRWAEQTILLRALIEAVPLPDTVGYLTVADSGGQFNLENLHPGRYIVYATADANGDRRRSLREAYDSVEVTLDSTANVALYTFPHDTVAPRPRTATFVDSLTVRVEFSQPLDATQSLDTTNLRVLELPDSTPVAIARILTQRQFDSLSAAARARADSEAAARRDSVAQDSIRVRPPRQPPPPAPPPAPPPPPAREGARPVRQYVDTALVRQLLARRPIPSDKLVIELVNPLKPETRYVVRVQGATNLIGKKGDGEVSFSVPKPTPRDTTQRRP